MTVTLTICPDCANEFVFSDDNIKSMDTGRQDRYCSCIYLRMITCPHCDVDVALEDLDTTWQIENTGKYKQSTSNFEQSGMLDCWF